MSIYRRSKTSLIIFKSYAFNKFFSVPTLNNMCGVLCSAIVSDQLKMRKSLGIHYWQDTISGVKVNNNVININKLWRVSAICNFVLFFTVTLFFFNSSKIGFSKNLRSWIPPSPSVSTGLLTNIQNIHVGIY